MKIVNEMDEFFSFFQGGDMATTRRYLDLTSRAATGLLDSDIPIIPININCLDPLGRSALSIGSNIPFTITIERPFRLFFFLSAIEYENLEMIELLLSYNVDTGEAILHAIDEEFVEGKISLVLSS